MKVILDTSADRLHGTCPRCGEHTEAGDSCCGEGACIEGDITTDQEGLEERENPTVYIKLVVDIDYDLAQEFRNFLDDIGIKSTNMYGKGGENKWTVGAHIPLANLSHTKID